MVMEHTKAGEQEHMNYRGEDRKLVMIPATASAVALSSPGPVACAVPEGGSGGAPEMSIWQRSDRTNRT